MAHLHDSGYKYLFSHAGATATAVLQTGTYAAAAAGSFTHTAAGADGLLVLNDGTTVTFIVIVGGATLASGDFVL